MGTRNSNPNDFILSRYPIEVRVSYVRAWLAQNDAVSKSNLIRLIYHRLHQRYLQPLQHVPKEHKSGFLMMATACLMIETLQSFYEGYRDTDGKGKAAFKDFFEREKDLFPGFADKDLNFYKNIRCGILHQAETTGCFRILREGPLLDMSRRVINANEFLRALEACLDRYIHSLHHSAERWDKAKLKIGFICDNCEVRKANST